MKKLRCIGQNMHYFKCLSVYEICKEDDRNYYFPNEPGFGIPKDLFQDLDEMPPFIDGLVFETEAGDVYTTVRIGSMVLAIRDCGKIKDSWCNVKSSLFHGHTFKNVYILDKNYFPARKETLHLHKKIWPMEPEKVELTLQEIADKFKINIEQIRIKE